MVADWFDDLPVLGERSEEDINRIEAELELQEFGARARGSSDSRGEPQRLGSRIRALAENREAYLARSHVFGYIEPNQNTHNGVVIRDARHVCPDTGMATQALKLSLDHARIYSYPGFGEHKILFDFYGQNQIEQEQIEHLHFNSMYVCRDNDSVGVCAAPIFVGLNASVEGITIKCRTVNVKSAGDQSFLKVLESDEVRAGLKLSKNHNPAVGLVARMAFSLSRTLAERSKNVSVQDFELGLDFSTISTRPKLREGSYVALQCPRRYYGSWDWNAWTYNASDGSVRSNDHNDLAPFNYLVFGVSAI